MWFHHEGYTVGKMCRVESSCEKASSRQVFLTNQGLAVWALKPPVRQQLVTLLTFHDTGLNAVSVGNKADP